MQDIKDIVNAEVLRMTTSGEIQEAVEKGVRDSINRAIKSQFESYGGITKQLENIFKENMKVDNRHLEIPSLNAVMTEVVNANINEFYKGQAAEKLHALMKEKLAPIPDSMKIGEFVEMICKCWFADEYDSFCDVSDYAIVEFEKTNHGWFKLEMWKNGKESTFGRDIKGDLEVTISSNGSIMGRHGSKNPYYLFDEDALIFKAYAQGVKFTELESFDPYDYDMSLKDSDY